MQNAETKCLKEITDDLLKMSKNDFEALLKKHEEGEFAKILIESGAIDIIMEDMKCRSILQNANQ